jgi:hypothetical protein
MHKMKSLIASVAVTAIAAATLAAPATAAPTKGYLTAVNGIPGVKVDVCIGSNKELRSKLGYGGVAKKRLAGTKALRFRKAGPGVCKGKVLGGKTVNFSGGADKTVVLTSKAPRVLVFGNATLGAQLAADPPDSALSVRHAADLANNKVYFLRTFWDNPIIEDDPITPSVAFPFGKGAHFSTNLWSAPGSILRLKATRSDHQIVVAKSPLVQLEPLNRYEMVLIGTKVVNAKLILIKTALASGPDVE